MASLRNLLLLIALFLLVWLLVVPVFAWLFSTMMDQDGHLSLTSDESKLKDWIRQEVGNRCSCSFFSWFNSAERIQSMIDEALRKYDADHLALADYALESVGAFVLPDYSSKTYTARSPTLNLFGVPILKRTITPNVILRKGSMPGHCWPMIGSQGHVLIHLAVPVRPQLLTLEHLPKSLSFDGQSRSAPKHFSVLGLHTVENDGDFLGRFMYDTTVMSHIQTFSVSSPTNITSYPLIKLVIESNWGHPEFTCIYRFRVHGQAELPSTY